MQITITANSAEELRAKVKELGLVFGASGSDRQLPFPSEVLGDGKKVRAKSEAKGEATSETKSETKSETEPAQTEPAQTTSPNKDLARKALETLNEKKGLEVARDILARFSCKRLSELPEEKYGEFISACEAGQ